MAKPGMMVYFNTMKTIGKLTDVQKGKLFWAMLEYSRDGTSPDFEDDLVLDVVWGTFEEILDRDSRAYDDTVEKRRYAVYVRECNKAGVEALSREDWRASIDAANHHMISGDTTRYPTTIINPNLNPNLNPNDQTPDTADMPPLDLSEEQIAHLVKWLGRDGFERCAARIRVELAAGKKIEDHYLAFLRVQGEIGNGGGAE